MKKTMSLVVAMMAFLMNACTSRQVDADTYLPIGDMYKDTFQAYIDTKFLGK